MKKEAISFLDGLITGDTPKKELDLIEFIKKCVKAFTEEPKAKNGNYGFINELYEKFYKTYCRRGSKEQGRKTFYKKLAKLKTEEEILEKARKIAKKYKISKAMWEDEGRQKQYIPLISSWLNATIPD